MDTVSKLHELIGAGSLISAVLLNGRLALATSHTLQDNHVNQSLITGSMVIVINRKWLLFY